MKHLLLLVILPLCATLVPAEPEVPGLSRAEAFQAMLKNATLKGSWAPVAKGRLGDEKKDGYKILRAEPKGGNTWHIVSRVKHNGRLVDVPIPVEVHFAADTAVMVLNDVPVGDGGTWSARILFHHDVYSGSWWSSARKKSGTVNGIITRDT